MRVKTEPDSASDDSSEADLSRLGRGSKKQPVSVKWRLRRSFLAQIRCPLKRYGFYLGAAAVKGIWVL